MGRIGQDSQPRAMLLALPLEKLQLLMASDAPKLEPIAVSFQDLKSRSPYAAG
jgi:hypothetical protein